MKWFKLKPMLLDISFMYSVFLMLMSSFMMLYGAWFYMFNMIIFVEWEIFQLNSVVVVFVLLLDWMSLTFLGVVFFISSMVLIYSYSYMHGDKYLTRFILLVYTFVMSMMLMVLSPNMISILLGWDGLGLVSYALVIYYQNVKSLNSGMITVLSNRVGDVAILVNISWCFNYGGWDFLYLQKSYSYMELKLVLFLVILAAITKSAQIPFSAWLPAAMAAPTPVSSLVHSSTLVTAGVYLLIRFNELLDINIYLLLISTLTLFMSGLSANYEFDLKKIIALSTLSQLGVMMLSLSLGFYELAFFHLISHAMFKSLLFLCAGFFIHQNEYFQDIRFIGGAGYLYPLSSLYFVGCSFSLCGFPFLSGFYSKDLILEAMFMTPMNWLVYVMMFLGVMFTFMYSIRLVFYLYLKPGKWVSMTVGESDLVMLFPMSSLFLVSISIGSIFSWMFLPSLVFILPSLMKLLVISVGVVLSMWLLMLISNIGFMFMKMNKLLMIMIWWGGQMWFMPYTSSIIFMPLLTHGKNYMKSLDHGWLEYGGGQGVMSKFMSLSSLVDKWGGLGFKTYMFIMFMVIMLLLILN